MGVAVSPLPQYAFMVWYSDKKPQRQIYLTFINSMEQSYYTSQSINKMCFLWSLCAIHVSYMIMTKIQLDIPVLVIACECEGM